MNKECFSYAIKFPQNPTLDGIIENICNFLFQKIEENNPVDERLYINLYILMITNNESNINSYWRTVFMSCLEVF